MDASHVYVRAWAPCCFYSLIFRRALTASVDNCAEIKSASSVTLLNLAEFGGRCRKRCSECGERAHSEHRFPARSFKLCQIWLRHPLKGHSLSPRSCPATRSAPSERYGYYDCRSNLTSKHARKHETHPPRVKRKEKKSSVSIQTILVLFELAWSVIKQTSDII